MRYGPIRKTKDQNVNAIFFSLSSFILKFFELYELFEIGKKVTKIMKMCEEKWRSLGSDDEIWMFITEKCHLEYS